MSGNPGKKADYSIASEAERQQVIEILQRNRDQILRQKRNLSEQDRTRLIALVDSLTLKVKDGEVITGTSFEMLVQLFRKKSPF